MRRWLAANGGPLALVVVGLGVGGFTYRWAGLGLIVVGGVWFSWQRISEGREAETSEELEPGEPSIYWDETGLSFQGGGNSTLLYFFVGHQAGTYPIRLKLYDDSDQPRKLEQDDTFTIPHRVVDEERRRTALDSIRQELEWNRDQLGHALRSGKYPFYGQSKTVFRTRGTGFRSLVDYDRIDAPFVPRIEDAYKECERIEGLIGPARGPVSVAEDDRVEWALVCVLDGIIAAETAHSLEPGP